MKNLKDRVLELQNLCIGLATGKQEKYEDYEKVRQDIVSEYVLITRLPKWLVESRHGSQFWAFIKKQSSTYQERRIFLYKEFGELIDYLNNIGVEPTNISISNVLKSCTTDTVSQAWKKCFERREIDPEGAITSARTLIETTCKYILGMNSVPYREEDDLPKLYKATARVLKLSPDQYNDQIIKQILGGCTSVVEGLGALRNKLGDAHGHGSERKKPSRRHAEFAVNLSGSLCSFLIATYEDTFKK